MEIVVILMYQRSVAILNQIIKDESYTSVEDLSTKFSVSRRTIYNDLDQINDWLEVNYDTELEQVRGKGFYLKSTVRNQILKNKDIAEVSYYEFSKEERRSWIYIYLVGQHKTYFIQDFQNLFKISRNTVIDDIKVLKEELYNSNLSLIAERKQGYKIYGDEITIRKILIHYLKEVVPKKTWLNYLKNIENMSREESINLKPYFIIVEKYLNEIKKYLYQYEQQVGLEITDEVLDDLIIWFYFFIQRVKQGNFAEVDSVEKDVIHTTEEFSGTITLCNRLSHYFQIYIPPGEVDYFTRYLLSAKVNYNLNLQLENLEMQKLTNVVEKMVNDFQKYAAVTFPERDRMVHNLLLHLKPTYYRKKYGVQIENVLKDSVKNNYPEIFQLTKGVIHHVEDFVGQTIDENEIAFVAIHFGGWLRSEGVELEPKRKRMLIVCTNGLGTSRLLKSQLEGLFSDIVITGVNSLRDYEDMPNLAIEVDLIVSTIVLPDKGVPVFVVDPILTNEDKLDLLKSVTGLFKSHGNKQIFSVDTMMDIINRYTVIEDKTSLKNELKSYLYSPTSLSNEYNSLNLLELLPKSRIEVITQAKNWEEAIFKASHQLISQGFIERKYVRKMIQTVKETGPYIVISDLVALPHANAGEGVNKTGMSMLFLKNEVDLMSKPVRIFIVLAAVDNEQHLKALSQLTQLFSDKNVKEEILKSDNKNELVEIIQTFLNI